MPRIWVGPFVSTAVGHRSGEHFGRSRPLLESPRPPSSSHRLSFLRRGPRLHENGLEATVVDSSDLSSPPLDGHRFKIWSSSRHELQLHRWRWSSEFPTAGDRSNQMITVWLWILGFGCLTTEMLLESGVSVEGLWWKWVSAMESVNGGSLNGLSG